MTKTAEFIEKYQNYITNIESNLDIMTDDMKRVMKFELSCYSEALNDFKKLEEYHNQFQVKLPTYEIIAEKYPIDNLDMKDKVRQLCRRQGAKWMRDLIKQQLPEQPKE